MYFHMFFFFFNDTATTEIYTLSLHDALPIFLRRRFGEWAGGFWLPECAHAQWLDPLVEEAGVRGVCVELTGLFGLGDRRHLTPLISDDGPVLWPIDRSVVALVWSDGGYPGGPAYRD